MKIIIPFLFVLTTLINNTSQINNEEYELLRIFDDTFSLIVSEDNSTLALVTDNNKLEVYNINSLEMLRRVKVTRNTWLNKGFFDEENKFLYFDYGMQMKIKYKKLNITTGKISKSNCNSFSKGCSYKAIKICDDDSKILLIENGKYKFEVEGIDIKMYKSK